MISKSFWKVWEIMREKGLSSCSDEREKYANVSEESKRKLYRPNLQECMRWRRLKGSVWEKHDWRSSFGESLIVGSNGWSSVAVQNGERGLVNCAENRRCKKPFRWERTYRVRGIGVQRSYHWEGKSRMRGWILQAELYFYYRSIDILALFSNRAQVAYTVHGTVGKK